MTQKVFYCLKTNGMNKYFYGEVKIFSMFTTSSEKTIIIIDCKAKASK